MEEKAAYRRLIAWEKADTLVREVYKATSSFPKTEIYGLTSQLRRAALSVPLNIIEGHARHNRKEFKNFLRIAYASLVEVEYLIDFAFEQKYLSEEDCKRLAEIRKECGQVLWRLLKSQL